MSQLFFSGEDAAESHALVQTLGIGAAAGGLTFPGQARLFVISVQQALDQPGIGRYVMRILLGVDGGGQAVGYCGGQRGAQGLVVAQDGIADVQLGVQAVFRVIVKDAQIAGQGPLVSS